MDQSFLKDLFEDHQQAQHRVPGSAACRFVEGVMQLLFPPLSEQRFETIDAIRVYAESLRIEFLSILTSMENSLPDSPVDIADDLIQRLPRLHHLLLQDAEAIAQGDPAAQSIEEVIRTYPGFKAVAVYRMANALYRLRVPLLPRILSEYAHAQTGIDIHPGATIGTQFCIDHGTGLVIGETAIIGNCVKVYQGVTLGAISVEKNMANIKRHPTIEDHVVIYAGATILGGNTVVGAYSVIGGNVWLTESVPRYSTVYHRPQIKVSRTVDPADVLNFSI
jgi:serine O-acetyltransferase